jgi:hypothetical protein
LRRAAPSEQTVHPTLPSDRPASAAGTTHQHDDRPGGLGASVFQGGALGQLPRLEIAPQRDQEFARERHDPNPPKARPAGRIPTLIPLAQGALRLPPQPTPREFNRERPQIAIARFADPVFLCQVTTRASRATQSRGGPDLSPIPKVSPRKKLRRVHPGAHFTNGPQGE